MVDTYITVKPSKGLPPGIIIHLILDENKDQVGRLTCDKDYATRYTFQKNLTELSWSDYLKHHLGDDLVSI